MHGPWIRDSGTQCVANMVLQGNGIRSRKIFFSTFIVVYMTECMIMPMKHSNNQMIRFIKSSSGVHVLGQGYGNISNGNRLLLRIPVQDTECFQVLDFNIKKVNRLLCRMGQIDVQSDKIKICYKRLVLHKSNSNSTIAMNIYK